MGIDQRVAVISTHLDDAVFSLGAGIAALARGGIDVRVITVLAGNPASNEPAGEWDAATGFSHAGEAARVRREEDRRACEILGATPIWFPYSDEQYDRGGSDEEIQDRLVSHLAGMDALVGPGFPLQHQDHAWLARLIRSLGAVDVPMGLYAEQPYLLGQGRPRFLDGVGQSVDPGSSWAPLPASAVDRRAKSAARQAYGSQLARLAQSYRCDWPELARRMDRRESMLGGELVAWIRSGSGSRGSESAVAPHWATTTARQGPPRRSWKRAVPRPVVRAVRAIRRWRERPPRVGRVRLGSLRRAEPISRQFGYDRGRPVDRYYIEAFLGAHAPDIRGRVLEVGNDEYTRRFGREIARVDVLCAPPATPKATIIADLVTGDGIPSDAFDCVVLTQTLQFIYDVRAAVSTIHRILRPGGVVLVTTPGISQIIRPDRQQWGEFWRLTSQSAAMLFEEFFGAGTVSVNTFGNVLAATAFLYGLADRELTRPELDALDADYEVLIGVRAVKREQEGPRGDSSPSS